MVLTNDERFYRTAQIIRNQGDVSRFDHQYLGNNYRMTDVFAAIGNSQINRFPATLKKRREKVLYYREHLQDVEYPKELNHTVNCYFFSLILTEKRDRLNQYLIQNGIETRITYPKPINEQPIFKKYSSETLPTAKEYSQKIISLPLYHSLKREEQDFIIKKINSFK
jgi:perosamine synthetase